MNLCKPSWEILEQKPGLDGIYEQIELAGRTCYESTRPKGQTAKDFVDKMIKLGHNGMLEHGAVYLKVPMSKVVNSLYESEWDILRENPYTKTNTDSNYYYYSTNYRVIIENDLQEVLDYLCEPTEYHEKRVTVRFICDRGVSHEFVRHRVFSFAQESTRYCNYSKDKFGNELVFIMPSWLTQEDIDYYNKTLESNSWYLPNGNTKPGIGTFIGMLYEAEDSYLALITEEGWTPQQARQILPNALKTELVMTGFVSDWEHFFRLRTSIFAETGKPHPDAAALADPLYKEFIKRGLMNLNL